MRAVMIPASGGPEVDQLNQVADRIEQEHREAEELRDRDRDSLTDEEKARVDDMRQFVNLVDARYQMGDGRLVPTDQGTNVRVRLTSVDAWIAGSMTVGSS